MPLGRPKALSVETGPTISIGKYKPLSKAIALKATWGLVGSLPNTLAAFWGLWELGLAQELWSMPEKTR